MRMPLIILALLLTSCGGDDDEATGKKLGPAPEITQSAPVLRRLTTSQYDNAIADLLGDGLVMPTSLEPDVAVDGLQNIGAGVMSVSAWGVERYEDAAYLLAEQALADDSWRSAHVGCDQLDTACVSDFLSTFGRRVWRRPLTEAEISRIGDVVAEVSADSDDFQLGMQYGLAALLMSPHFLYRVENGTPSGAQRALDDYEIATRLSFLLWNTIPDDALLDAAAAGTLSTDDGLQAEAERLMDDPRFREGVRALFTDVLELYALDDLTKDPLVFTHASPALGLAAREETLLGLEALIIDEDRDFRLWMTSQRTFVDRHLAALYNVQAPAEEGFAEIFLDAGDQRRGLLGQASVLALHAHSGSSSSTLRGVFVLQKLLCKNIPPPPADVDTSIPEADATSPTLRERMLNHQQDPVCATCHVSIDGIGLGLENFDGIGRWRDTENGAVIDSTGEVDGERFADAWDLAKKIGDNPDFASCMVQHLYSYTTGQTVSTGDAALIGWLAEGFAADRHSYRALMMATIESPAFRRVGAFE